MDSSSKDQEAVTHPESGVADLIHTRTKKTFITGVAAPDSHPIA